MTKVLGKCTETSSEKYITSMIGFHGASTILQTLKFSFLVYFPHMESHRWHSVENLQSFRQTNGTRKHDMTIFARLIVVCIFGLSLLGATGPAMAATKKPAVTYCPKIEFVCKPCQATPNPPSSSTNPDDTCCSFVVTGWNQRFLFRIFEQHRSLWIKRHLKPHKIVRLRCFWP